MKVGNLVRKKNNRERIGIIIEVGIQYRRHADMFASVLWPDDITPPAIHKEKHLEVIG